MSSKIFSGRAKAYRLNAAGGWDDVGVGELCAAGPRITLIADSRLVIFDDILDAEDELTQKEKILSLAKATRDEELAFSFFSQDSCEAVFNELDVGRRQPMQVGACEPLAAAAGAEPLSSHAPALLSGTGGAMALQPLPWPHGLRSHGSLPSVGHDSDGEEDASASLGSAADAALRSMSSVASTHMSEDASDGAPSVAEDDRSRLGAMVADAGIDSGRSRGQPIPMPVLQAHVADDGVESVAADEAAAAVMGMATDAARHIEPPHSALRALSALDQLAPASDALSEAAGQEEAQGADGDEAEDHAMAVAAALDLRSALTASAGGDADDDAAAAAGGMSLEADNAVFLDSHADGNDDDADADADADGEAGGELFAAGLGMNMLSAGVGGDADVDYGQDVDADAEAEVEVEADAEADGGAQGSLQGTAASGMGLAAYGQAPAAAPMGLSALARMSHTGPGRPSASLSLRGRGGARRQPLNLGLRAGTVAGLAASHGLLHGPDAGAAGSEEHATSLPLRRLARLSRRIARAQRVLRAPALGAGATAAAAARLPSPAQLLGAIEAALNAIDEAEEGDTPSGGAASARSTPSDWDDDEDDDDDEAEDSDRPGERHGSHGPGPGPGTGPATSEGLVRVLLEGEEVLVKSLPRAFVEAEWSGDAATLAALGRVVSRLVFLCEPDLIDSLVDDQRFAMTLAAFERESTRQAAPASDAFSPRPFPSALTSVAASSIARCITDRSAPCVCSSLCCRHSLRARQAVQARGEQLGALPPAALPWPVPRGAVQGAPHIPTDLPARCVACSCRATGAPGAAAMLLTWLLQYYFVLTIHCSACCFLLCTCACAPADTVLSKHSGDAVMGTLTTMVATPLREVVSLALESGWVNKLLQAIRKDGAPQQNAATQFALLHGVASGAGAPAGSSPASASRASSSGAAAAAPESEGPVAATAAPSRIGTLVPPADVPVLVGNAANVCSQCSWGWLPRGGADNNGGESQYHDGGAGSSGGAARSASAPESAPPDFLSQRERALMCLTELYALCRSTGDRDGFLRALTGNVQPPPSGLALGLGLGHGHGWYGRGVPHHPPPPPSNGNATGSADAPVACLLTVLADRNASAREVSAALDLLAAMVESDASGVRKHVVARGMHPPAAPLGTAPGGAVAGISAKLLHRSSSGATSSSAARPDADTSDAAASVSASVSGAASSARPLRLIDDGRSIRLWEKLHALGKPYCYFAGDERAGAAAGSSGGASGIDCGSDSAVACDVPASAATATSAQLPVTPGRSSSHGASKAEGASGGDGGGTADAGDDYDYDCFGDACAGGAPFIASAGAVADLLAFNAAGKERGEHGLLMPRPHVDADRPAAATASVMHALVWRAIDDPEPAIQTAAVEVLKLLCTGESTAPAAAAGGAAGGVIFATAQEREAFLQVLYDHYAGWLTVPFTVAGSGSGAVPAGDPVAAMDILLAAVRAAVKEQVEGTGSVGAAHPSASAAQALSQKSASLGGGSPSLTPSPGLLFSQASLSSRSAPSFGPALRPRVDPRAVLTPAVRRRIVAALQPDPAIPASRGAALAPAAAAGGAGKPTARAAAAAAAAPGRAPVAAGSESPMSRASKASLLDLLAAFMRAHTFRVKYLALTSHLMTRAARLCRYADVHLQLAALRFLRTVLSGKDEFYLKSLGKPSPVFADLMAVFVRTGGSAGHAQQLHADELRPAGNASSWFPSMGSAGRGSIGIGIGMGGPADGSPRAAPLGAGPASLLRSACLEALETLIKSAIMPLIQQVATAYKPLLLLVSLHSFVSLDFDLPCLCERSFP